ncbi:MAG: thioredoxin domain-containing protein [Phycisphaerae bacterium]
MADRTTSQTAARANRLADSTSPYLLQHAHNPVDWFPWDIEALEKARREDKPIFLSIGYAACHWCHVMEKESFENPAIAAILNEHFVSIKVDREERPDLDDLYMKATLLCNQGNGGWPMSVFLLPDDQTPFFAGTYFPPTSRYGRIGFADLLTRIAGLWRDARDEIHRAAASLAEAVRQFSRPATLDTSITNDMVSSEAASLAAAFDPVQGGILGGGTNKFPPSMAMSLMLREYAHSLQRGQPASVLLDRVTLTLDKMANGGIYDHLAGGIARYSTDPNWLVPHFEKMLYDQALVSAVYLEAFQVTGNRRYAEVAYHILDYVLADMKSPEGAFYSAWDADSEGVEGKYYVWSKTEVMAALGQREGAIFCSYYDVTDQGNWEGCNILNVQREAPLVARLHGISVAQLEEILTNGRRKLLQVRLRRVPPALDDKILTAWNALMIASLARAAVLLGEQRYARAASTAADFILTHLIANGRLLRTWRNGKAHTPAYLDDYAFLVEALLELHQATLDWRWLERATQINEEMLRLFWDDREGAFYFTASDAESLFARTKDFRDGAVPSGNSVAIINLLRLATILGEDDLRRKAEQSLRAVAGDLRHGPFGHERLLAAVDLFCSPSTAIIIAGDRLDAATQELIAVAREGYDPARTILIMDPSEQLPGQCHAPALKSLTLQDGKATAYVCHAWTCRAPVAAPDELRSLLSNLGRNI